MKIKTLAVLVATATTVSGCGMFGEEGMFRNRSGDYRHAVEMPPLVVPEDMDSESIGQLYPVPPIPETAVTEHFDTVPRPQPLAANSIDEVIRIQSLGDERWILSNRDPSEIWPRVRNILNRSGIPTARAEAAQGILETVWLEFKGDEESNHRYRFYIQPGVQMNSTEIKVLHDQMSKNGAEKTAWPEVSVDDGREKDMVEILANALAGDVTSGTVSLLAQAIGGEQKVEFVTPKVADPYLLMRLDEERAWASLAYSLNRGGFTIVDQDRSAGTFYVNYTPPEDDKEPGFFKRMLGRGEKVVEVNYQIRLSRSDEGSQIRVLDKDGNGLERNEAIRLLRGVRANLS